MPMTLGGQAITEVETFTVQRYKGHKKSQLYELAFLCLFYNVRLEQRKYRKVLFKTFTDKN
jgi:hypothetical protein